MTEMDKNQFDEFNKKLDLILRMLAVDKLQGKKQVEQVKILSDFGFRPSEIATVLGRELSTITGQLSRLKRAARKTKQVDANNDKQEDL